MDKAGQDATMEFEDVGHSNDARKTLEQFVVGELPPSERSAAQSSGAGSSGAGGSSMLMMLLPLILAIGAGYFFYAS